MAYTSKIETDDDVMTVAEFRSSAEQKGLIDYDGFGCPAKDGLIDDDIWIKPSMPEEIPADATHIVWYNR